MSDFYNSNAATSNTKNNAFSNKTIGDFYDNDNDNEFYNDNDFYDEIGGGNDTDGEGEKFGGKSDDETDNENLDTDDDLDSDNLDSDNLDLDTDTDTDDDNVMEENIFSQTENYNVNICKKENRLTSNYLCLEELTALISTRTSQIENGMKPLVKIKLNDTSKKIAIRELKKNKLPLKVIRKVGDRIEEWSINELDYDENLIK